MPFRRRPPILWASEATREPTGNRTRLRGFADHGPRQRSGSFLLLVRWAGIEPASRVWHTHSLPLTYHRMTDGRPSFETLAGEHLTEQAARPRWSAPPQSGQRESNPHRRVGSPPSYRWTMPANLHGAVKGNRTPIASLASSQSTVDLPPRNTLERTAGVEPASTGWDPVLLTVGRCPRSLGAARGNRTRHLLRTKQAPRSLGLDSMLTK